MYTVTVRLVINTSYVISYEISYEITSEVTSYVILYKISHEFTSEVSLSSFGTIDIRKTKNIAKPMAKFVCMGCLSSFPSPYHGIDSILS